MLPLAVYDHHANDIRKRPPPHDQSAPQPSPPAIVETASRSSAAPDAALTAAQPVFAALGLDEAAFATGAELAALVAQLTEDPDIALAAWLAQARAAGATLDAPAATKRLGAAPARLADKLEHLGEFGLPADWTANRGLTAQQAETLRKMLLAIAADPRLIVARLAAELVQLRRARALPDAARLRLALETREIFAPLANRLGIWSL